MPYHLLSSLFVLAAAGPLNDSGAPLTLRLNHKSVKNLEVVLEQRA